MCLVKFIDITTCSGEECALVVEPQSQSDTIPDAPCVSGDVHSKRNKIKRVLSRIQAKRDFTKSQSSTNISYCQKPFTKNATTNKHVLFCPLEEYAMIEPERDGQLIEHMFERKSMVPVDPNTTEKQDQKWYPEGVFNVASLGQDLLCCFRVDENPYQTMASKLMERLSPDHQSNKYPITAMVNYVTPVFKWKENDKGMLESQMICKYEAVDDDKVKMWDDGKTVAHPKSDFPSEIKGSSQAFDTRIGCTSTSHEIRWTQIEQDLLNNERTIATSCSSIGPNGEPRESLASSGKKTDEIPDTETSLNGNPFQGSPLVRLDSAYPSPEHSLPISFDRYDCPGKSHKETDQLTSSWSSTRYKSFCSCSTSLAVRYSTGPPSNEPNSNSLDYCIRDGAVCCMRCGTSMWHCDTTESYDGGTSSMRGALAKALPDKSYQSVSRSVSRCLSIDAPRLIEPPPARLRLLSSTSNVDEDDDDEDSSFSLAKLENYDREIYARFGKCLTKPTMPKYKQLKHIVATHKYSSLTTFDKWTQIDFDLRKLTTHDSSRNGHRSGLKCTYVEVSFGRNLESVPRPAYLNQSDSRTVFTMLDRQLKNTIATHIIEGNFPDQIQSSGDVASMNAHSAVTTEIGDGTGRPVTGRQPRDKSCQIHEDNSSSKGESSRLAGRCYGFGGAYIFSHGPQNVRPPKPWWDHIHVPSSSCIRDCKIMAAWKAGSTGIIVGGLINHGCHLRIVASSNDDRLGSVYGQALLITSQITSKGMRYEDPVPSGEVQPRMSMMIRIQFDSPELTRLVACNGEDMSVILGLDALNLGVKLVKKSTHLEKNGILLYTKNNAFYLDQHLLGLVIEGIRRIHTLHSELVNSFGHFKPHIMPVESLAFLLRLISLRSPNYPCYTKNYLTPQLEQQLRAKITSFGGTLAHCIRANAYYNNSTCPVATDPEAYEVFRDLFAPIIKEINGLTKLNHSDKAMYDLPDECTNMRTPQSVLSYRIRYSRNLQGFGFPAVLSSDDYKRIEALCQSALLSWTEFGLGQCYSVANLREHHPRLHEMLSKKHLLMHRRAALLKARGAFRHWPEGRSIYVAPRINPFLDLVAHINAEDHLKVICIDWSGKHPFLAHNHITRLMKWLDSHLKFCRLPGLGFLSPSPQNVGTGMQMSAFVRYQHLRSSRAKLEELCSRDQYNLRIQYASLEQSSFLNNIIEIATFQSNGLAEFQITQRFITALNRLCNPEVRYSKLCQLPDIRNTGFVQRHLVNRLRPSNRL